MSAPRIVLHNWGSRFVVTIEPRRVDMPSRVFRTAAQAAECALALNRSEGWPIEDRIQSAGPSVA